MEQLLQETLRVFETQFGREARWVVTAPGRVNVIGEHTDYNDGFVFPMAIERGVIIAAAPAKASDDIPAGQARIYSVAKKKFVNVPLSGEILPGEQVQWFDYVRGVIAGCLEEGVQADAFVAVIHSNVPLGGGLSSSAALEVATATLLEEITGKTFNPVQKALLCQKAEHVFAKMPCGIMDQFISAMGEKDNIMLLDCQDCTTQMVPFVSEAMGILITNSKVKHALSGSEYPERRSSCHDAAKILGVASLRELTMEQLEAGRDRLTDRQYRRAKHVVGEISRTLEAAQAFRDSNYAEAGKRMYASHDSLRDDFEVSCPEIDILVEIARGIGPDGGVLGSRITGGGFGGCTVTLIEMARRDSIMQTLRDEYVAKTGIEPEMFVTRPAQGAHIIS